jgi:thymidine kinase
MGKRVMVAGLDMDSNANPFPPMPELMAMAEMVTKLRAICVKCGNDAVYSYRMAKSEDIICVGGKESYEARCRKCYFS